MMFNVPQFIDVEDKIAGPLTWRQLLWMIGMGAVLLTFFNLFDTSLFIIIAIPTILFFVLFAFYRPNGFSMVTFAFYALLFLFRPKVSVWQRPAKARPIAKEPEKQGASPNINSKQIELERLKALASILDSRGKSESRIKN